MFEYSVITPSADKDNTFFIVPLEEEEHFIAADNNAGTYQSVRLDLMLEILNGYQAHRNQHAGSFETEHYHYSRTELEKGVLAKVTSRKG